MEVATFVGATLTATGFTETTAGFCATAFTFTVFGEGFALVCAALCGATFTLAGEAFTAGFSADVEVCANTAADIVNMSVNVNNNTRVLFIASYLFTGAATAGGVSWLKNVVATQVATTLSFGAY